MTVAVSTVTSLTQLSRLLLQVASDSLDTTTAGAPDLVYMSPAAPAYDCCPALILNVGALTEESTQPLSPPAATGRRTSYGRLSLATFVITALRCAAVPDQNGSTSPDEIEASAVQVQEDGWALWNGIHCAIKNSVFLDVCSDIHIDRSVPINEQGGCVGWQFTIRAEIGGIPCSPSFS